MISQRLQKNMISSLDLMKQYIRRLLSRQAQANPDIWALLEYLVPAVSALFTISNTVECVPKWGNDLPEFYKILRRF
jgi:hypothetical protein